MKNISLAIITFILGFTAAYWKLNVSANVELASKMNEAQTELNKYRSLNTELSRLSGKVVDGDYQEIRQKLSNLRDNNGEQSRFLNLPIRLIESINSYLNLSSENETAAQSWQQRYATVMDSLRFYRTSLSANRQLWLKSTDSLTYMVQKTTLERDSLFNNLTSIQGRNKLLQFKNKNNKVIFIGEASQEMANGYGMAVWQTGGIYTGEWKDNLRHGQGKYEWADGMLYEGGFKDDERHGYGVYKWLNGDIYEGEWRANMRHGKGKFYNSTSGKVIFEGEWVDDNPKR